MPAPDPQFAARRARPSADLVAQAQQEYAQAQQFADELLDKTRALLAAGWSDFEVVTDVFATLYVQRDKASMPLLVSAVGVVRLAKTSPPDLDTPA